jgi:hypothetical protein
MNIHFERYETVPAYTRNLTSTDQIKWSAEFEVPAIGFASTASAEPRSWAMPFTAATWA